METLPKKCVAGESGAVSPALSSRSTSYGSRESSCRSSPDCCRSARKKNLLERKCMVLAAQQQLLDAKLHSKPKCGDGNPEFFGTWSVDFERRSSSCSQRSRQQETLREVTREKLRAPSRSARAAELSMRVQEKLEPSVPTAPRCRSRPSPLRPLPVTPPQSDRLALYAAAIF